MSNAPTFPRLGTPQEDPRLTRTEAAAYIGVSEQFLAVDVVNRKHKVPYLKIGRRCVYIRSQLDAWMHSRMVNSPKS